MSCKYPESSRSYMFCIACKDVNFCPSSMLNIPMTDNVKPSKNTIPTAAEAKNATELAKENFIAKQLEKLSFDINNAANKGRYDIKNDGTLCLAVKRRLKDLGYEVITGYKCTNGNQYKESYYKISWE